MLSDTNGETFNVGNNQEEISIRNLAELACQVAGPPGIGIEYRISEDASYLTDNPQRRCPDLTKICKRFPWTPKIPLKTGLERTLLSYLEESLKEDD